MVIVISPLQYDESVIIQNQTASCEQAFVGTEKEKDPLGMRRESLITDNNNYCLNAKWCMNTTEKTQGHLIQP